VVAAETGGINEKVVCRGHALRGRLDGRERDRCVCRGGNRQLWQNWQDDSDQVGLPHAQSICAFSGQNPERFLDPSDPDFEPGRTQSWGQIPKEVRDTLPTELHPGNSCNGHTGEIAAGGGQ